MQNIAKFVFNLNLICTCEFFKRTSLRSLAAFKQQKCAKKRGSHDNKPQSREETGRETTKKPPVKGGWRGGGKLHSPKRLVQFPGLLVLHDGAISHNRPQIASDRTKTIHEKLHNLNQINHF